MPRALGRLLLCVALIPCLTGCLTRALWDRDPSTPVHFSSIQCEARAVHGRLASSGQPNRLALRFVPSGDPNYLPVHLAVLAQKPESALLLAPPTFASETDWLRQPGAERFEVKEVGFRVFKGDYLTEHELRATLDFAGSLPTDQVVQRVPAADTQVALATAAPSEPEPDEQRFSEHNHRRRTDPTSHSLQQFHRHRWLQLLAPERKELWTQQTALGFQIEDQPLCSAETFRQALARSPDPDALLASANLIGKLDHAVGRRTLIRVPLPILLQDDLSLQRKGDRVEFVRRQVWCGRLLSPHQDASALATLPRLNLGLRTPTFAFRHGRRAPHGTLLQDVFAAIMTPATLVIDFVLRANPIYLMWHALTAPPESRRRSK